MARLDLDIDNFSGSNGRGTRYDIKANGVVLYHDVSDEDVDWLCSEMQRKSYLYENIEIIKLNK